MTKSCSHSLGETPMESTGHLSESAAENLFHRLSLEVKMPRLKSSLFSWEEKMSPKKYKTHFSMSEVPPHFSSWSAGFAEEVGNVMQFTLSLYTLSPVTSLSALPCMGIAHTSALGVWLSGELCTTPLTTWEALYLFACSLGSLGLRKTPVYPNKAFLHLL